MKTELVEYNKLIANRVKDNLDVNKGKKGEKFNYVLEWKNYN
jgi:hypothetical protein